MFNLNLTNQNAFALDVAGDSIKLIQLQKTSGLPQIKAYTTSPLAKGILSNDTIIDQKNFIQILQEAIKKPLYGKFSSEHIVASLPESKSFVRVIQIPKMSDSEAESAIPVEAESFIPMPIDQVYMDWKQIGVSGDKMNILIVASPKEIVDGYLEILDKAGLKTVGFEVESLSCQRSLMPKLSQDTILIVDIDALRTSLIMIEDGNLQFTSTIPVAGSNFTDGLAKYLGVSQAKAEEIKTRVGIANTADYPNIKTAMLPVLTSLAAEIKNILNFHRDHSEKQVSMVLLAGGGAKLKNLPTFLSSELGEFSGLKVEVGDPCMHLTKTPMPPFETLESLGYVTSIGLALRNYL